MQYNDENKLFVGGLPWALDSDDLREVVPSPTHGPVSLPVGIPSDPCQRAPWLKSKCFAWQVFQEFGDIEQANVVFDRETGRSK